MLHHVIAAVTTDAPASYSVWSDYIHTLFDPGHILTELTVTALFDGVIGALLWPWLKRRNIRRHDAKFHRGADHISEEERVLNAKIEAAVQARIEDYFRANPVNFDFDGDLPLATKTRIGCGSVIGSRFRPPMENI